MNNGPERSEASKNKKAVKKQKQKPEAHESLF